MTLLTIQLKSLRRLMPHVKNILVKRIGCHFPKPHTLTRSYRSLLDEFADALNGADAVYLAQIYGSARETDNGQSR